MMRLNYFMYRTWYFDGYARYGLAQIKALAREGVDVRPALLMDLEPPGWFQRLQGLDLTRLNLVLAPPHEMAAMAGRQWSLTMYESTGLPYDWDQHLNQKAERVIVPCEWCADVFRANGVEKRIPIDVVPGGVDPEEFPVQDIPLPERPYTFLAFGDRGTRKGSDLAWQAFYKAFPTEPDVRLVIKVRKHGLPWLTSGNSSERRIAVWREDVGSLADVYQMVDCVVFPTRGEGWGMFPREAACMGKPVICTNFSGTAVGIEHWAIPIERYTLRTALIKGGGEWAQADVDEIAEHMRWCFEHRDEAKAKGLAAAQWLRENQTWQHSAKALMALVEEWG